QQQERRERHQPDRHCLLGVDPGEGSQQLRKQAMKHTFVESKSCARDLVGAWLPSPQALRLCADQAQWVRFAGPQGPPVAPPVRLRWLARTMRFAAGNGTANRLRAFRDDLQLQRVQFPRLVSGTVNRSVMLDTVLRALASAQGSSATP